MLPTLIKALNTTDLMEVVKHLSLPPIDINLLLEDAINDGTIQVDKKKGKVSLLVEPSLVHYDRELADKILRTIDSYDKQQANVTRSRLEQDVLGLGGQYGYPIHEFICTMYAIEQGVVSHHSPVYTYEIKVPEIKDKRPENIFQFYTCFDHQEFGARAVNKFIDQWTKINVK